MNIERVVATLRRPDRAPARYGQNTYKLSPRLRRLLEMHGWHYAGEGKSYIYMQPPSISSENDPFTLDVEVPTEEETLTLATERHRADEKWGEYVLGWMATYVPRRPYQIQSVGLFSDKRGAVEHGGFNYAIFEIGDHSLWHAQVTWDGERPQYAVSIQSGQNEPSGRLGGVAPVAVPAPVGTPEEIPLFPDELPDGDTYIEGAAKQVTVNAYERDPEARAACIRHYGVSCHVCGFDFESRYGPLGNEFIHVHHLTPISAIAAEYEVDPVRDLRPVCPNCHAMIHRRTPPFSPEELRDILATLSAAGGATRSV